MSQYPADWPRCPGCGRPALDGHITCGSVECDEHGTRRARERAREAGQAPRFAIGQRVMKWTGGYTGPGFVRGIVTLPDGTLRYLVGHIIEGGSGEFLHVYMEGNLR